MPSSEDAATLAAYVAGVDRAAVEMETKWGMDRLPMLVNDDLRAKFNRQATSWSEAIAAAYDANFVTRDQMQAVTVKSAAMQRAWAALDAFAEEAGHRAIAPWVWEARLHTGPWPLSFRPTPRRRRSLPRAGSCASSRWKRSPT